MLTEFYMILRLWLCKQSIYERCLFAVVWALLLYWVIFILRSGIVSQQWEQPCIWAIVWENREFLEDIIISRLFKDEPTNERVKKNFSAIFVNIAYSKCYNCNTRFWMTIFCHGMLMEGLVDIFATRMHQLSEIYSIYLSGKISATLPCTLYTNEILLWIQEKKCLKNIISQSQNISCCRSL